MLKSPTINICTEQLARAQCIVLENQIVTVLLICKRTMRQTKAMCFPENKERGGSKFGFTKNELEQLISRAKCSNRYVQTVN